MFNGLGDLPVWPGSAVVLWLVGGLLVALVGVPLGLWLWLMLGRPHIRGPPLGVFAKDFNEKREKAFVPIFLEYGKTCELEGFLATCDPALVSTILKAPHTEQRSRFYKASEYLLYGMSGLLNMDGSEWRLHRSALYHLFYGGNVDKYANAVHGVYRRHARAWLEGRVSEAGYLAPDRPTAEAAGDRRGTVRGGGPDLVEAVRGAGLEALMSFAFDLDPHGKTGRELAQALVRYPAILADMGKQGLLAIPGGFWRLHQCTEDIRSIVAMMIEARKSESCRYAGASAVHDGSVPIPDTHTSGISPEGRIDAVRSMMDHGMGPREIAAEVNHVHGAHKAAGFFIACALWRLQLPDNRKWQEGMRREWRSSLGPEGIPQRRDVEPAAAAHARLPITKAVVNECLRMHVVSLGTGRRTAQPLEFAGVKMPAGCEVGVMLHALHHHPDHFSDPLEFDPGRWLPKGHPMASTRTALEAAFQPFLSGPRNCAGRLLAYLEIAVGLHAVLETCDLQCSAKELVMRADLYASLEEPIAFVATPPKPLVE